MGAQLLGANVTDTMTDANSTTEDAPSAPVSPSPAPAAEDKAKRGRGALEADVKRVCDQFATGAVTVPDGELLTPHRIAKIINPTDPPSTGAVAANLDRWAEIGFAKVNEKPVAFLDYTDEGRSKGLTALKAESSERKRAARKAAKDAEKAAAPAPVPAPEANDGQTQTI